MKKISVFLGVVIAAMMAIGVMAPTAVYADGVLKETVSEGERTSCSSSLLGFRPWYEGLQVKRNGKCVVGTPADGKVPAFVWTIVLNVLADLFSAVAVVAIGFVVYGGFLYIMSSGEPGKVAKGKSTLVSAVIGLAIALLANLIINTIMAAINGGLV